MGYDWRAAPPTITPSSAMTRKPVQIAVVPDTYTHYETLYALCDDGSLWFLMQPCAGVDRGEWKPLPPIPADEDV
jgi:hypothetical protein